MRSVWVTYCDDIRNEVGNKQSFIGIYRNALYVPDFPALLPKICIVINAQTDRANPFKSLRFRLLNFDTQIAEAVIPEDQIQTQQTAASTGLPNDALIVCGVVMVLSPLPVTEPMRLRVRVDVDGEELKGPALIISKQEESASSALPVTLGVTQ